MHPRHIEDVFEIRSLRPQPEVGGHTCPRSFSSVSIERLPSQLTFSVKQQEEATATMDYMLRFTVMEIMC